MKNILMKIILASLLTLLSMQVTAQDGLHLRNRNLPCLEKDFPVYVHITVDSTTRQPFLSQADIENLMDEVSKLFEPICMSFSACEVNILRNYTFHNIVNRLRLQELAKLYSKPRRLNIFIVGTIPERHCGSSTYYGILKEGGENIYIETDDCRENLAGQLAHHIGHYFGLADTYHNNDIEIVDDPDCAIKSDSICDTPTDPFGLFTSIPGAYQNVEPTPAIIGLFARACEFTHLELDPNGRFYQPQVGNVMSAYPCKCGLTNGQFLKIVENYNSSNSKPY